MAKTRERIASLAEGVAGTKAKDMNKNKSELESSIEMIYIYMILIQT